MKSKRRVKPTKRVKKTVPVNEPNRGMIIGRAINLAIMLAQRQYTVTEIVEHRGFPSESRKTLNHRNGKYYKQVYRDLKIIEFAGIPLIQDGPRYSVDHHFMRRFI